MKKFLMILAVAVIAISMSTAAMADFEDHESQTWNDAQGIAGSVHDFGDGVSANDVGNTDEGIWNSTGEICRVCHIPHDDGNASARYVNGLLWNRDISGVEYTLYDSPSFDGTNGGQPGGISQLCLSCHDGTIALDKFGNHGGDSGNVMGDIYGGALADFVIPDGTSILGTHPISMDYTGTELNDISTTMGDSGTIGDNLFDSKVECASCHDVHNQESVPNTHLLRVGQSTNVTGGSASGLCLTCHIK